MCNQTVHFADVTCTPLNRREVKKAETREALAREALRLAVELGPDRVTVERISDAAGVSPRTFFNHFESKEDAILDFEVGELSELGAAILARPAHEPPLAAIRAVVADMAQPRHSDPEAMARRMRLTHSHPALHARMLVKFGAFEDSMATALAQRLDLDVAADARPRIIAAAVLAAVRTAVMHELETAERPDITAASLRVFDLLDSDLAALD